MRLCKRNRLQPGLQRANAMLSAEIEARSGEAPRNRIKVMRCNAWIVDSNLWALKVVAKGLDTLGALLSKLRQLQDPRRARVGSNDFKTHTHTHGLKPKA